LASLFWGIDQRLAAEALMQVKPARWPEIRDGLENAGGNKKPRLGKTAGSEKFLTAKTQIKPRKLKRET
jgi:hypothetical protein